MLTSCSLRRSAVALMIPACAGWQPATTQKAANGAHPQSSKLFLSSWLKGAMLGWWEPIPGGMSIRVDGSQVHAHHRLSSSELQLMAASGRAAAPPNAGVGRSFAVGGCTGGGGGGCGMTGATAGWGSAGGGGGKSAAAGAYSGAAGTGGRAPAGGGGGGCRGAAGEGALILRRVW